MNADEIVRALERIAEKLDRLNDSISGDTVIDAAELITTLQHQLASSQRRERAAVECIEDIEYQNRKFAHNWIDDAIADWRGPVSGEESR